MFYFDHYIVLAVFVSKLAVTAANMGPFENLNIFSNTWTHSGNHHCSNSSDQKLDFLHSVYGLIANNKDNIIHYRALFLNHSIISSLCLVRVRAPHWPHVRQAKFCLRVCQVVFLWVLPFSPTY